MEVARDTKDWTWVLRRRCPECGVDAGGIPPEDVAGMLREAAATWVGVLRSGPRVRQRPEPGTWSPLEYGCHARDVNRVYEQRLTLMLAEDDPPFANWDQDETALAQRYGQQDPLVVAGELDESARTLAARFDAVHGDEWDRTGRRSDGARFTVATLAQYFIHDVLHHLWDVTDRRT
jgi:DinB superfamily